VDLSWREVDFDCKIRIGIVGDVVRFAGKGCRNGRQLLWCEEIAEVGFEAARDRWTFPGRLAALQAWDVQLEPECTHETAEAHLVALMVVAGGHDLEVLPVVGHADVLTFPDTIDQGLVDMPSHVSDGNPYFAPLPVVANLRGRSSTPGRSWTCDRGHDLPS